MWCFLSEVYKHFNVYFTFFTLPSCRNTEQNICSSFHLCKIFVNKDWLPQTENVIITQNDLEAKLKS